MIRDLLRTIGMGCILAGGILYFTEGHEIDASVDTQDMQAEVEKLKSELAKAREELAIAQTTSSVNANDSTVVQVGDSNLPEKTGQQVLTIERGANSVVVSAELERAGIIEDAAAFDAYLVANGLSIQLQIGEHEVDPSMDFQTIAEIITTVK